MSTTIDQRVVEMRFDNKHFESNVSNTMSTLDKLKQKLNFSGASKGLEEIDSASKRINMAGLGSAVESVSAKFSALQVMGVTALANITNSAVNAGKRIASALTIDSVKAGFQEYETQINSVQTILANTSSKGTTLQEVNSALDTLNTYADKTIYNFTEMTRNIGTFTAAGVDLETSVKSIQGIANLAAVSGSTSQQASTAMYQLSQALAAGKVQLMDWNSVVNAGMGGEVFQNALVRTAAALDGSAKSVESWRKSNIDSFGSFRESLTEGEWLTTEVLTKTLEQFTLANTEANKQMLISQGYTEEQAQAILKMAETATDAATKVKTFSQLWDTLKESAQSGWTSTWEIIVGDFEEAKSFLTNISDTLGPMISETAKARNDMLSGALSSGWKQLLNQGISDEEGYKEQIKSVAKEHGVAIDQMIEDEGSFEAALKKGLSEGTITSDMLTESVHKLGDKIRGMSEEEREAAGYTTEHLTALEELESGLKKGTISMDEFAKKITELSGREVLIKTLWNAFEGIMSVIKPVKEAFREIFPPMTAERLRGIIDSVHELSEKFKLSETTSDNLKRTFKGLFALLDIGAQAIKAVFGGIGDFIGFVAPAGEGLLGFTAKIGDYLVGVDEAVKKSNIFGKAIDKIGTVFGKVGDFLNPIVDGVKEFAKSISGSFGEIADVAKVRFEPLKILGQAIKAIFVGIGNVLKKVAPWFASLANSVGDGFTSLMDKIATALQGADYNTFFDIFNGGVFAAIGVGIAKFVKSLGGVTDGAGGFLENINGILESVGDSFEAFTQQIKSKTLLTIASAIALLAASLIALSLVDSEKLTVSLAAISAVLLELMGAMSIMSKISGGMDLKGMLGLTVVSKSITNLAKALLILAAALKILSTLSWEELAISLTATIVGLGALVAAVNLLPEKKISSAARSITTLSIALVVFGAAMKILGSLSWEELAIGLTATVAGLAALVAAVHLLPKGLKVQALAILTLSAAMVVLGAALKIMATMSWSDIARGLTALAGSLAAITIAVNLMPKSLPLIGAGLLIVASSLVVLSGALKVMGTMSWDEIARGLVALGGSLAILAIGVNAMKGTLLAAAAMLIVAEAVLVFTPALMMLGSMSLDEIGRGLLALAGAFTVIGVAGLLLKPLAPTILALSAAITLFGIGCAAVGAGVLAFSAGMTALAASGAAGAAAIVTILSSVIGLIPYFIEQVGVGIIKFCEVISGSASAICKAISVIIQAAVEALVSSVPIIVEGVFVLIDSLLSTLVEYTPSIVSKIFDFLIGIINAIADRLPELIQAGVNLVMSFFSGVISALEGIDPSTLVNGLLAVGVLTALMAALAAAAVLTPLAMVGVLGIGAVVTELALVLAAIGALSQIPGLQWLASEGGAFMQTIGTAIGNFIGSIVGGIAQGMSSVLPQIGTDLSDFMANIQPFIDGAKSIDSTVLDGVKTLIGVILALTGANILESLTSWLTGGSSLSDFGAEVASFGPYIKQYADAVTGIDTAAIKASASAAKALSELAANLPNSGGLAGLLAGENDISSFGEQLVPFGEGMRAYSKAVVGIDTQAIITSAGAAKALAEMTAIIPNEGGVVGWFTGENSISKFGSELIMLGMGLKGYAIATAGIDANAIVASVTAAKALADMTAIIPNEGGVVGWFSGENSISKFGNDLISLGMGLKGYAIATAGIDTQAIISSVGAAKALAEMTAIIPNEGGVVAWFTGESSVSRFSNDLISLGLGLRGFSLATVGILPESIIAAANAAKALAEMTSVIPNEGGVVSWFAGDNSIASFAYQLPLLGSGLKSFSDSVEGILPENIISAANAAKVLAEMTATIPNEGGVVAWFTGESSISNFANQLPALGEGLKSFSTSVEGIVPENIVSAANAAKVLAEMTSTIPNEGGVIAWFTGESSISNFADKLPGLGKGLKGFSDSVEGISPENVTAAANAAESLGRMTSNIPKDSARICTFGDNLVDFGESLSSYFSKTSGITGESIASSKNAVDAVKTISTVSYGNLNSIAEGIENVGDSLKSLSDIDDRLVTNFKDTLSNLGKTGINSFIDEFSEARTDATNAIKKLLDDIVNVMKRNHNVFSNQGQTLMNKFNSGISKARGNASTTLKSAITNMVSTIKSYYQSFYNAGSHLVSGFANGISANSYKAAAKAKAMAQAAENAAKKQLQEHSPSKVGYEIGDYFGVAFVNGIADNVRTAYSISSEMADKARSGLSNAISKVNDVLNSDMDAQPTIRPVLDLTNIKSGTRTLSDMLNFDSSTPVMANVNAIGATINQRNQNGGNEDVVSAIDKLRRGLDNVGNTTYSINGITYDDEGRVAEAIKTLVRAARTERRV